MNDQDFSLFIIHAIVDGGWRVEFRTLNSVHPTIDYTDGEKLLEGISSLVKARQP